MFLIVMLFALMFGVAFLIVMLSVVILTAMAPATKPPYIRRVMRQRSQLFGSGGSVAGRARNC
jgi:hypothetical protein